jgi:para-nitrobenzyl esterase
MRMDAMVEIESGTLRGQRAGEAVCFLGIPYAADTGGANRLLAPRPVPRWSGVRNATRTGDRCPQTVENICGWPMFSWYGESSAFSENCCVLNVFTPDLQRDAQRPVIFYIHGGGWASGGSGSPALDGSRLAAFGDVVVVTVNHRLNVFGYTALAHLNDERFADAGHAGQLDLVAALRWVQRNIGAFGGDSDNVTLMGQSGGGNKMMTLLTMPAARGLFRRGINMGGVSGLHLARPQDTQPCVDAMLRLLGVGAHDLEHLQRLPVETLLRARRQAVAAVRADGAQPVVDGRHVLASPFNPEGLAMQATVPLIVGSTDSESTLFLGQDRRNFEVDEAELLARIEADLGVGRAQAEALVTAYREEEGVCSAADVLVQLASDLLARGHLIRAAEAKAAVGAAPVYLYNFAWKIREDGGVWRSPHTVDIPFAFGTLDVARSMTGPHIGADAAEVSRRMMSAFVAFAKHGDPNHHGLPDWPRYDAVRRSTMVFDAPCRTVADYRGAGRIASAPLLRPEPARLTRGPLFRGLC